MPSRTFSPSAGYQTWTVPDGVDRVDLDLRGAGTGAVAGGHVSGTLKVGKGSVLYLLVGGAGQAPNGRQGGGVSAGGGGKGGDGAPGQSGGKGGGGCAAVRLNSGDGSIRAVAAGAGGRSGDAGNGGAGGDTTGQAGHEGGAGSAPIGNATGGTQIQPGAGGSSSAGSGLAGSDAAGGNLGRGGAGGQNPNRPSDGGGGGGGGYRGGGGGCASVQGTAPGGGGAGGSNFTGGLITSSSSSGGGNTDDAAITITWVTPPPANQPPGVPSQAKVNGKAESAAMTTRSVGTVTISAIVQDTSSHTVAPTHIGGPSTQAHQESRLVVRYSDHKSMSGARTISSDLVAAGKRAQVKLTGLSTNTHYYARLYAQDSSGLRSSNYNAVDFWTNRPPVEPTLQGPADNGTISVLDATTFNWKFNDPDDKDTQGAFTIRWRKAKTPTRSPGPWTVHTFTTAFDNYVADPETFKTGVYYEWTVRTQDAQHAWGPWAVARAFYVTGTTIPPTLISPSKDEAVEISDTVTLVWAFRNTAIGATQAKADIRYRVVDTSEWVTVLGDVDTPGPDGFWEFPIDTFAPRMRYEWQARTTTQGDVSPSDWSDSETFHTYVSVVDNIPVDYTDIGQVLGSGTNRVYIYDRGGIVRRGEITPTNSVSWSRVRDDLGSIKVTTSGFDSDSKALFKQTHTWTHELVVFRDGKRVAEGPIINITDSPTGFTMTAYDVMGYLYRRIMRQGYNDTYKVVNNVVEGLRSVVERAGLIIANALAPNDPNVLPYLTLVSYPDDATEARTVPDYGRSAFDEVDDMAANAGLDYSVIGRRIILNDTHRPVGRGIELRTENFTAPPVITEYGLSLADYYAATDNNGLWGAAEHKDSPYGGVEILATGFTDSNAEAKSQTRAQRDRIVKSLVDQAKRGIASRYPAPYQVRVPDNTQLLPDTPIDINSLVPGVWHPLRAQGTVIEISQWQKLDQVNVTQDATGEQVTVVMSPAPNRGQDPDADEAAEEVDS